MEKLEINRKVSTGTIKGTSTIELTGSLEDTQELVNEILVLRRKSKYLRVISYEKFPVLSKLINEILIEVE